MLRRLRPNVAKYGAIAQINLQNSLAYTGELAYRSVFMVVILYVFVQLWRATYQAAGALTIAGLSFADTLWYLVMTETIELSRARFADQMSAEVKDGSLAYTISRPYNYLLYHWSFGLGDTLLRLVINFAAGTLLVTALVGPMPLDPLYALPLLLNILLAMALNFLHSRADRPCGIHYGRCGKPPDHLPKVLVHSGRHVDPARFLSGLAAGCVADLAVQLYDVCSGAAVRRVRLDALAQRRCDAGGVVGRVRAGTVGAVSRRAALCFDQWGVTK